MKNNLAKFVEAVSFAARKHKLQKRKGADEEPYVNHVIEVANLLATIGGVDDFDVLIAALLHDTVEDTETTEAEISEKFGSNVAKMVLEVSDDKALPKDERKRLQIEHAPHLSDGAKTIKLGDKISNIRDVTENPPDGWSKERRIEYVEWGERVVEGLRGANDALEKHFDETAARAKDTFSRI